MVNIQVSVVRSLAELSLSPKDKIFTSLVLKKSPDLVCNNLMCEKVTQPCLCRLERVLENYPYPNRFESIDLSDNGLDRIPYSLRRYNNLKMIDLSGNAIAKLSDEDVIMFESLKSLKSLILANNPLSDTHLEKLQKFTKK